MLLLKSLKMTERGRDIKVDVLLLSIRLCNRYNIVNVATVNLAALAKQMTTIMMCKVNSLPRAAVTLGCGRSTDGCGER